LALATYQLDTRRRTLVIVLALLGLVCAWILESTKVKQKTASYEVKKRAVELASQAYGTLRTYYTADLGRRIDPDDDPAGTGLIGPRTSAITNARGNIAEKRTTLNPNLAAVIVDYLRQIGLKPGQSVAVSTSGSFPGMNVDLYAALEAMGLRPIVITAVTSSSWGATDPDFTWLDMERILAQRDVLHFRSAAATPGGSDDMGYTLSPDGKRMVREAMKRNDVPEIQANSLEESIAQRMETYYGKAGAGKIAAYINVGAVTASLGASLEDVPLRSGLYFDLWKVNFPRDGTLVRFAKAGTPVIHLCAAQEIAREYGLAVAPRFMPEVGEGEALERQGYNATVAIVLLVVYLGLILFLTMPELRRVLVRPNPAAESKG
jgi:poly-gamma-glutamate system protein